MGAQIDLTQGFSWDLTGTEPNQNDTPFPNGSYEHLYWNLYKQIYIPICQHASDGDVKALLWHRRCLGLLQEQVQEMVAVIEADADKASDK